VVFFCGFFFSSSSFNLIWYFRLYKNLKHRWWWDEGNGRCWPRCLTRFRSRRMRTGRSADRPNRCRGFRNRSHPLHHRRQQYRFQKWRKPKRWWWRRSTRTGNWPASWSAAGCQTAAIAAPSSSAGSAALDSTGPCAAHGVDPAPPTSWWNAWLGSKAPGLCGAPIPVLAAPNLSISPGTSAAEPVCSSTNPENTTTEWIHY